MKLLYVGTLCDTQEYKKMLSNTKDSPSIASMVFEKSLIEGMHLNNIDLDVYSFPMVPDVFKSKVWGWGKKPHMLSNGYHVDLIPTVNFPLIKQISRAVTSHNMIKKWLKSNTNSDCAVLMYSFFPFAVSNVVKLCKKYQKKCFVVVPDLPLNMFMNHKLGLIKRIFSKVYLKPALKYQSKFDGYIYLTEAMKDVINTDAPYVVVEGIADINIFESIEKTKYSKRAIMYAGRLNEKYGIKTIIESYLRIPHDNHELWLFGDGDFVDEIEKYTKKDNSIKFFGRVDRIKVLENECKATLLVNFRDGSTEYTKYSFPSKMMEYMLSGTPVFITDLPGIPNEYYSFVYHIDEISLEKISAALENIITKSDEELNIKGRCAKKFILDQKNSFKQSKKIVDFIQNEIGV